ncbi:MAG: glycerate kinase [Chloroflexi bacterium]|nr:MAG: glycerate kinase [Chloroflexota bacterium]
MRILVCPQEFKGSLTASEAAQAIAAGLRDALPDAELELLPMADGGPGTVEIVYAAAGGTLVTSEVRGPLGAPVQATFGLLGGEPPRAIVEAAAAAGLLLLHPHERQPTHASTYGVGQQIAAAIEAGTREVIVGVGGTATNDGGAGALQALGVRLLDADGHELGPGPLELSRLDRIDASGVTPEVRETRLRVAVDVRNPLLGPAGATAIYGPQKGVTPEFGDMIEAALEHWVAMLARDLGVVATGLEGGGAGGGLPAGLAALPSTVGGAVVEGGAVLVGEAVGLDAAIARADLVVTVEGSLDAQTGYGKTVSYVAERAAFLRVPCIAVAGVVASLPEGVRDAEAAQPDGVASEDAMARAAELVREAAARLGRRVAG